jgi:hypothetical protein
MSDWYYADEDQSYGPFSEDDIRKLFEDGVLMPETYVWSDEPGKSERGWVSAVDTELWRFFYETPPAPAQRTQTFSSNNSYQPGRYKFAEETKSEKPSFVKRVIVKFIIASVVIFSLLRIPELTRLAGYTLTSAKPTYRTETYAGITFNINSWWEQRKEKDGRMIYYPPSWSYTGFIQCSFSEISIGNVTDEEARARMSGGISGAMGNTNNAEEISRKYFKVGNRHAARVSFYFDRSEAGIDEYKHEDKRGRVDMVCVLFEDGMAVLMSIFTTSEYEDSYKNIIETTLGSVGLERGADKIQTESTTTPEPLAVTTPQPTSAPTSEQAEVPTPTIPQVSEPASKQTAEPIPTPLPVTPALQPAEKPKAYKYNGPKYEIVDSHGTGIGLTRYWVYTNGFNYSTDTFREQVKAIFTDIARNKKTDKLIIEVATDKEIIYFKSDNTIIQYTDKYGMDYYTKKIRPKEEKCWIAGYTGGYDYNESKRSDKDSAFQIDWYIAEYTDRDDLYTEQWKPDLDQ